MEIKDSYSFDDFRKIIARLRDKDGCPWDREQTHESLRDCMLEEAYEAAEGIDIYHKTGDDTNLCEELGDIMLQVMLHARIGEEEGRFTVDDVITSISKKMINRHPHVFGQGHADNSAQVLDNWEEIKKKEKSEQTITEGMRRVAKALPATIRASKVQKKAAKVGFDFQDWKGAAAKISEELSEVSEAAENSDFSHLQEEIGDLMFSVINLSRLLGVNAENALTNATEKFINRFEYVEEEAVKRGFNLSDMSIRQMDALWSETKHPKEQ